MGNRELQEENICPVPAFGTEREDNGGYGRKQMAARRPDAHEREACGPGGCETDACQAGGYRIAARREAAEKAEGLLDQMSVEEQALLLKYESPAIPRLGIGEYNWWNEALHGVARAGTATVFPVPIAMAASFDRELVKAIGDCISTEGRAKYNEFVKEKDFGIFKGLTYWCPNINLFRDPRWGRGHETFGEDPYLTGQMGAALIAGIQGDDPRFLKAAACVKHFAVHSGPEALRHEFDASVSEKELWESYLPAFEYCVRKGQAEGAMGGYSSLNGTPLCGNTRLIQEILRETWGFLGYYVSDCWALRDFHEHHMVTSTPAESAAMALNAGCDINCGSCYAQIMQAYNLGLTDREAIRRSARRALTTRLLLGMGQETPWDHLTYRDVDTEEARALNLRAARESIVLLKNDGILPLKPENLSFLGIIGPNADSTVVLQGNYHGTASHFVTVMEGMRQALSLWEQEEEGRKAPRLLYGAGCEIMTAKAERLACEYDRLSEARAVAKASDVVILCVGLDERYEGEAHHISTGECIGGDKEDLEFPQCQRRLMEEVLSLDTPVILCVMAGSCMNLGPYEKRAAAVIQAWYPGAMGGRAIGDILIGAWSPSGKLPVTFYGEDYELPDFTDYSFRNRTYRYVEKGVLYPFGYGLTYGRTEMTGGSYDRTGRRVLFQIRSLCSGAVDEVVQVYKKNPLSPHEVRNTVLCGFTRVHLEPGEEAEGEIRLEEHAFTTVDQSGKRVEDGMVTIYIGTHGPDELSCRLTGTGVLGLTLEL